VDVTAELGLHAADERADAIEPMQALAAFLKVANDIAVLDHLRAAHESARTGSWDDASLCQRAAHLRPAM
jgi:hypothetical protein